MDRPEIKNLGGVKAAGDAKAEGKDFGNGNPVVISRNEITLLAWQLDGLFVGLTTAANTGQEISDATRALFKKLYGDVYHIVHGRCVEGLPSADTTMSLGDMLVLAQVLKSTLTSFLSPEELREYQEVSAFELGKWNSSRKAEAFSKK